MRQLLLASTATLALSAIAMETPANAYVGGGGTQGCEPRIEAGGTWMGSGPSKTPGGMQFTGFKTACGQLSTDACPNQEIPYCISPTCVASGETAISPYWECGNNL